MKLYLRSYVAIMNKVILNTNLILHDLLNMFALGTVI